MSKIDELLAQQCPNGVEFKTLGELGTFLGGLSGKSKENFKNGNAKFITYMNVFSNISLNLDVTDTVKIGEGEKQNTIQYGDVLFTGSSETPNECGMSSVLTVRTDEMLYLNSFCFIYRFNDSELFLPSFSKYLFRSDYLRKQIIKTASGVTRFNVSKAKMAKVKIPVLPLAIQSKIVKVLDNFTELTAELTARKQQYLYYLNRFFENSNAETVPLASLGTLKRGKRFVHADATDDGVPCIHYGELYTYYGVYANEVRSHIREDLRSKMRYATSGDVIIVGAGENKEDIGVGVAWYGDEDVAVHDACYTLSHKQNPKYISYFLRSNMYHQQIVKYVYEGKICSISAENVGKALIPIPPIEEQDKIVSILDRFDKLCTDLSYGLPAEIEARRKQYEYYRDKLLSFKEQ